MERKCDMRGLRYLWERDGAKFFGIQNPEDEHHRILFFLDKIKKSALVYWVNMVKINNTNTTERENRSQPMKIMDAQDLWKRMIEQGWVRDDSVPPRLIPLD